MKRVSIFDLFFNLTHKSRRKRGKEILNRGTVVVLVVLVVAKELLGAEVPGSLNRVPGVTLDDVSHRDGIFRVGQIRDGVHSTISEMVPNSVLEVDETTGRE